MNVFNNLVCLSLSGLSSLVLCLRVRLEPTKEKHLSGGPLQGRLLASLTNIELGWKSLQEQTF